MPHVEQRIDHIKLEEPALDLVHAALDPKTTCLLVDLLERVALSAGAFGCVLWEAVPPLPGVEGETCGDSLFVLDSWFADDGRPFARHDLPIARSIPGQAMVSNEIQVVNDFALRAGAERENIFPGQRSVTASCAFPVVHPDVHQGALSVYRIDGRPFTPDEVARLASLSRLLPPLYQAMRNRASYGLLKDVERELQKADNDANGRILSRTEKRSLLQRLCELVGRSLPCLEVSVYLNDRLDDPHNYRRMGTTLTDSLGGDSYRKTEQEDGLTGWVLFHARPIRIFDLKSFAEDKERIRESYPNITWEDRVKIKHVAMSEFEAKSEAQLPPLSVMAAPNPRRERGDRGHSLRSCTWSILFCKPR